MDHLETGTNPLDTYAGEALSPYLNIIDSGNLGSSKSTNKSIFSMPAQDQLLTAVNKLGVGIDKEMNGVHQQHRFSKENQAYNFHHT